MIQTSRPREWTLNTYPTSDGKPMAETEWHRDLMLELIETLKIWYADEPSTYVSGNMLVYYEKGNKRRHVAPDVFAVRGVSKHMRGNYLLWEEGKGLDAVIELTSKTTMREDLVKKRDLYLTKLGVKEYFLFDPKESYLKPSFQALRRVGNRFVPIKPIDGRIPSKVLKLHLERSGWQLRLWDPIGKQRVLTPGEISAAEAARADQEKARADEAAAQADEALAQADEALAQADEALAQADEARVRAEQADTRANQAENEVARLRRLLEERHRNGHGNGK